MMGFTLGGTSRSYLTLFTPRMSLMYFCKPFYDSLYLVLMVKIFLLVIWSSGPRYALISVSFPHEYAILSLLSETCSLCLVLL